MLAPNLQNEIVVVVKNSNGMHARPSMALKETADRFSCDIMVMSALARADAKSVVELIILEAGEGTQLKVRAKGSDAPQALAAIAEFFEQTWE